MSKLTDELSKDVKKLADQFVDEEMENTEDYAILRGFIIDRCMEEARVLLWGSARTLQIDSYATGQKLVHSYIKDDFIIIDITNGSSTWLGKIPLPENW